MERRGNTGKEIVDSGEFVKAGKKRYIHDETGLEIFYDHNAWLWVIPNGERYSMLWPAVHRLRWLINEAAAKVAV